MPRTVRTPAEPQSPPNARLGAGARASGAVETEPRLVATHPETAPAVFTAESLSVHYGKYRAVRDVDLRIHPNEITAFIGPSGCGKTTVLRCFNRMNDLVAGARVDRKSVV